jgi:lysozyme
MRNRTIIGLSSLLLGVLTACAIAPPVPPPEGEVPLTAGIFLEPEGRFVLPEGVKIRPIYPKGIDTTKSCEGFRGRLYNDAAYYCTIAYGHLVKKSPCDGNEPREFRIGLTEPQGADLLVHDMGAAQRAVMIMVTADLTDGQYAALCDFVFNVGPSNLQHSTLLKVVNDQQFDRVPAQFQRWVRAGGKVIDGLKTRREREIKLFFDGMPIPRAAPAEGEDVSEIDIRIGESLR